MVIKMKQTSLKDFFGFAVIVDLRNFSEICRRLLIQKGGLNEKSNAIKRRIYSAFYQFFMNTLDDVVIENKKIVFDYKHTGDGFLFITNHNKHGVNTNSSFQLLLKIYSSLSGSIPLLNKELINILLFEDDNEQIIQNNDHLSYIKRLFTDPKTIKGKEYIKFSVGAHCGRIFYQAHGNKHLFLGNAINLAARLQELSKLFSEFNLYFSDKIKMKIKENVKNDNSLPISKVVDLRKLEIRGIGPTKVCAIKENDISKVLKYFKRLGVTS